MSIAKNREQYVAAWTAHVNDLLSLTIPANFDVSEFDHLSRELRSLVSRAADKVYGPEQVLEPLDAEAAYANSHGYFAEDYTTDADRKRAQMAMVQPS